MNKETLELELKKFILALTVVLVVYGNVYWGVAGFFTGIIMLLVYDRLFGWWFIPKGRGGR